jgi:hypothetical protein
MRGKSAGAERFEHLVDGLQLFHGFRRAAVDQHQQQVGVQRLFQGGMETGDQLVRQLAQESDRVGQQHGAAAGQPPRSRAGVQR